MLPVNHILQINIKITIMKSPEISELQGFFLFMDG